MDHIQVVEPTPGPTAVPTNTPLPLSTPRPTPVAPVIQVFDVQPSYIEEGQCVQVIWRVGAEAELIQIFRNNVVILDNAPHQGNETDCLQVTGSYLYTLEATNSGIAVSKSQTVEVVSSGTDNPLAGTIWELLSYLAAQGNENTPILDGTRITTAFNAGGELAGFGGCNPYSASYSASSGNFSIGSLTATKKVCNEISGMMEQENAYFAVLPAATTYQISGGQLMLANSSGATLATYQEIVAQPLSFR